MESLKPVFSVHELNEYIDILLGVDPNLKSLAVEGELEGVKRDYLQIQYELHDNSIGITR